MIVEVNNDGTIETINIEDSINDLLDKVEAVEKRHLSDTEMRDLSNAFINMIKPHIVKIVNQEVY